MPHDVVSIQGGFYYFVYNQPHFRAWFYYFVYNQPNFRESLTFDDFRCGTRSIGPKIQIKDKLGLKIYTC